jgi:hypothetical protein
MTSSRATHAWFFLLLVIILSLGWWLAGERMASSLKASAKQARLSRATSSGPQDPPYCRIDAIPVPAPAMEHPFGVHLYASNPRSSIMPMPAMAVAEQLATPSGQGSNETALDDVQSVTTLLEEYRRAFGAMPFGEFNDEIVRHLQGQNPKGVAVLPKTHRSLNKNGELIDRWGVPYRFHPDSAWQISVRSAGPDKRMWTTDDILSHPEQTQAAL